MFFWVLCDLDESSMHPWGNFGRLTTPAKVHHCSKFLPFLNNGSRRGSLESQSFRNGFVNLFRLRDVNEFVSHLLLKIVAVSAVFLNLLAHSTLTCSI